ncbi:PREDICTED: cytochrome P450 6k1-like [Nicrophorus vespilloides]|uniref:Cytochrome P450 6k1-like n=1 Tax=Nicrophorus vespilloides TaxID=110193 RepID=A0ABM1MYC5_NICVS|nr:PREDICTED: cytochrome P450 6k1-like [Nicrophorus vespilloides]
MIALLIPVVLLLLYWYFARIFRYWKTRNVPYIEPVFPFGNFKNVALMRESIGVFVANMYKSSKEDFIGIWVLTTPSLIFRSPELLKHILVKDFNYFYDRPVLAEEDVDFIGANMLFFQKNPEWKAVRSKIGAVFSLSKLRGMVTIVDKIGEDMMKYLKKSGNDFEMNSRELCAKLTTDVIVSCGFGINANCFEDEKSPFREAGKKLFDLTLFNCLRVICYFLVPSIARLFKISFFDPKGVNFLRRVFWQAIDEREESKISRHDLIDILINLRQSESIPNFVGDKLAAQSIQFYAAGFETTSTGFSFSLYQIALHPDIQEKLRDEIHQFYNEHHEFTYDNIKSLTYLDKVFSETLRMHPGLPFLNRMTMNDYTIPETKHVIEKGTPIYISVLGLHFDPEYYPDPEIFDPERFSEENIKSRPEYAYLPFGNGPRNCIGARFAVMVTKICVAKILLQYKIEACEATPKKIEYDPNSFLAAPKGALTLRFIKINN